MKIYDGGLCIFVIPAGSSEPPINLLTSDPGKLATGRTGYRKDHQIKGNGQVARTRKISKTGKISTCVNKYARKLP